MDKININADLKEQFDVLGFSYPYKKSSGKYGIRGTTQLDAPTLQEAETKIVQHLLASKLITLTENN